LDQLVPGWATSEVMLGSKQLKKALKAGDTLVKKGLERLADGLGAALANVLVTTGCDKVREPWQVHSNGSHFVFCFLKCDLLSHL
jgi:hypothetical protein